MTRLFTQREWAWESLYSSVLPTIDVGDLSITTLRMTHERVLSRLLSTGVSSACHTLSPSRTPSSSPLNPLPPVTGSASLVARDFFMNRSSLFLPLNHTDLASLLPLQGVFRLQLERSENPITLLNANIGFAPPLGLSRLFKSKCKNFQTTLTSHLLSPSPLPPYPVQTTGLWSIR